MTDSHPMAASNWQAVDAARGEAERMGSDAIGAEHVLLAAVQEPGGLRVLAALGLPLEAARERLAAGSRKGRALPAPEGGPLALTSYARRLLEAAAREAGERNRPLDPEVVLLAAFREPRGTIQRLLNDAGRTAAAARNAALEAIGAPPEPETPPLPAPVPAPAPERPRERKPVAPERPPKESRGDSTRGGARRAERPPKPSPGKERSERPPEPQVPAATPAPSASPVEPRRPLRHLRRDPIPWGPRWRQLLLLAVPAAAIAEFTHQSAGLVFGLSCLAVVPLAAFMGEATEHVAARTGPTVGGLLNATFGNAAELIIAIVALQAGLVQLVKASITGSILGNLLLIFGLSLVAGGTRFKELRFNRTAAGMSAGMHAAAVVALVFPALFHATHPDPSRITELQISEGVAVVLIVTYALSLVFTLRTHRWLIGGDPHDAPGPLWSIGRSVGVLAVATVGVGWMSEILVRATEAATRSLGVSETFLGLIVIPLIGNAAEHATAVTVARKGKLDLALQIAFGSSTQIALLVAPVLVFLGLGIGQGMNLVFTPFEVMAVAVAMVITALTTLDGESHWFEGVQVLAVYAMIGVAAFFL